MADRQLDGITGAFGFTGRAIAERLIGSGRDVVTLSRRSGDGDPLQPRIRVEPFDPDRADRLVAALSGVDTLYNTYWLRFPRGAATFERAIARSAVLLAAAREAGVRRIVHLSVVHASVDAETPYMRAKAALESVVQNAGLDWTIVRPTLTFGPGDTLINNLAWSLRRLPIFGVAGRGRYRVQPVHVDDVARICIEAGAAAPGSTIDAAGPETFAYGELVDTVRAAIGSRSIVVPVPGALVLAAARGLGLVVDDVVMTRDEMRELTSSRLTSTEPARGTIRLSEWLAENASSLGRRWSSELVRNYRPSG
jgi:NADH dehydrogenase